MRSGPTSGLRFSMRFRFASALVCAALTSCYFQLPSPAESFSPIQKHVRFQIHSSPARSGPFSPVRSQFKHLLAAPETKSRFEANYNATEVSSASIAEVERAWTLDSEAASSLKGDLSIGTPSTSTQSLLLNVDVLGPLFCISFVIFFLCSTLLNSGGISDTFVDMNLSQKLDVLGKISWFPGQAQEAQLVVGLVMAFSAFAQALTGFGFAVVAVGAMSTMPWLLHSELFNVITPVAATLGALVGFILLIPYAFASPTEGNEDEPGLEWDQILPLLIPCTVLTPLGIQLNNMVDPILATRVLAALIMGFVAYKLVPTIQDALGSADSNTPELNDEDEDASFLQSQTAAILFGSAAGIFGGAFDVQGPPLCVYGDAKGWSPAQFRNNVLAVVCLNSALVVAIDAAQGALGDFYYSYFCLTSLPGVLLGMVAGQYASERIDPVLFKNVVLVMCLGLGVQLLTAS
mmetsp:Transcript_14922/g.41516  ORF Transcript_14922/g.41516 Transcript_14922/m.41516 type:complete len:462 (+) Transcript_14922:369-1754(+)